MKRLWVHLRGLRRRDLLRGGLYGGVFLTAVLVTQAVVAQEPRIERPALGFTDPDRGLAREEVGATHDSRWDSSGGGHWNGFRRTWPAGRTFAHWNGRRVTPSLVEGQPDLPSAIARARLIVVGEVTAVSFVAPQETIVTLRVETTLLGESNAEVQIAMLGGPFPNQDYKDGVFIYNPGSPVLLEGERALLFLEHYRMNYYEVQNFSGFYRLDESETVRALEGNPFFRDIDGLTLDEVAALIRQAQP